MRDPACVVKWGVVAWAGAVMFAGSGCTSVARKIIQGTDHGAPAAVVAESERHELLELTTREGTKIAAMFGAALDAEGNARADAARRPTVIFCYPGGYTLRRTEEIFQRWRRRGANVIVPEYPGFGMSEGEPTEEGCYAAAEAAWMYLNSRDGIDREKIVAAGWSVGGGAAVDLASRRPVRGLIVFGTATGMADVVERIADESAPWKWIPRWTIELLVSKVRLDSVSKMPAVGCPVLVVEGGADELVPKEMTDRLVAAARTRVTRHTVPGARHGDLLKEEREELWRVVEAWMEEVEDVADHPTAAAGVEGSQRSDRTGRVT